jgi:hypothetical protein
MRNLTLQFSLFSACLFNLVPLSAQAQLTINNTQNTAISGSNNQVTQVINQTIIYRPQRSQNSSNNSFFKKDEKEDHEDNKSWNRHHKNHDREFHKGDGDNK